MEELRVRCEANREREHIDVRLEVQNNRLIKENVMMGEFE